VIPRLKLQGQTRVGAPAWPSFEERHATPLYLGRRHYRKLVVLLDAEVIGGANLSSWNKGYLLAGLLTLEVIECTRYADDGPPADAARRQDNLMGEAVPGWAVLSPDDSTGYRSARTATEDHISDHAVFGNAPDVAEKDTRTDAYSDREPAEAAARRRADALAAMVAHSIGADIFITRRPYLRAMSWNVADGVTFADVDEALARIGLFLRPRVNTSHLVAARDMAPTP